MAWAVKFDIRVAPWNIKKCTKIYGVVLGILLS
jgi:hypothetical protein